MPLWPSDIRPAMIRRPAFRAGTARMRRALASPGGFALATAAYIVAALLVDRGVDPVGEAAIGAVTWGALLLACRGLDPLDRARVAALVLVATVGEVVGSQLFEWYTYRRHDLPRLRPAGPRPRLSRGAASGPQLVHPSSRPGGDARRAGDRRRLGAGRRDGDDPRRRGRCAVHEPARDPAPAQPGAHAVRLHVRVRRAAGDLRDGGRHLALGRAGPELRAARGQPAERDRRRLLPLRRARAPARAAPAAAVAGAPARLAPARRRAECEQVI